MTAKSTELRSTGKAAKPEKPPKPYPDFPLFAHDTGRWAKKICGKLKYFGPWDNWQAALEKYQERREDLHAGRTPQQGRNTLTVRQLCNQFIANKRAKTDAGRLSPRTFIDYDIACKRLVDLWGDRLVTSLGPKDFETLNNKMSVKYKANSLASEMIMTRSVFKYALAMELIDKGINFGPDFRVTADEKRVDKAKTRHEHGKRMLEAHEIRAMLEAALPQLKAMILLGANAGFGNSDCSALPLSALDLDGGWVDFPRPKTGIHRRVPLWPETVAALRDVIANRKTPGDSADANCVFVTKYGQRWVRYSIVEEKKFGKIKVRPKQDDAVSKETTKLLKKLNLKRPGLGFYSLRHGFETKAGGCADQVAVNSIMGHVDPTMGANYREGMIADDRLRAVVNHVHAWLFPQPMVS